MHFLPEGEILLPLGEVRLPPVQGCILLLEILLGEGYVKGKCALGPFLSILVIK
jgi:hypothetical protein